MPQIRPIRDLRNTAEISQAFHESDEPIFITKNGYGDMVVMSMDTYEQKMAKLDLYEKIAAGEDDIKNGKVRNVEDVFAELRTKHFE